MENNFERKVKIFECSSPKKLEKKLNKFLQTTDILEIESINYCATSENQEYYGYNQALVLYRELRVK